MSRWILNVQVIINVIKVNIVSTRNPMLLERGCNRTVCVLLTYRPTRYYSKTPWNEILRYCLEPVTGSSFNENYRNVCRLYDVIPVE